MTNLSLALRELLEEQVPFSTLELVHEAKSVDGTVKALFHTAEGHPVEAVLMRFRDGRRSVCLSSQSGCPLTCTFCATGQMQFRRNLTAWEILDQALHFRRLEPIDHVVFMGMGEPMLNFDAVVAAARRLPDLGVTHRRTTISTVGWLPGLTPLRRRGRRADPARPLAACADRCVAERDHAGERPLSPRGRRRRVRALLRAASSQGVRRVRHARPASTTRSTHARGLAELLDPKIFKVNMIPYNPTGMFDGSSRETMAAFKDALARVRVLPHAAADARPRHRSRLRSARGDGLTAHAG